MEIIPIHNFSADDESSIAFQFVPLKQRSHYDTTVPHRHNYYEVFIFVKGGGTHVIDFNTYNIESNSIHFVSPGQVHKVNRELDTYGSVILFSREFYSTNAADKNVLFNHPFLNNNSPEPILNLTAEQMTPILQTVESIESAYTEDFSQKEDILRAYLSVLLLQAQRLYEISKPHIPYADTSLLKNFRIQLENNFSKMHKVKEYAQLLNISEKVLNDTLKNETGKTASEHIFERLILESKRLLLHSGYSVKEVAYFLGFSDPGHFSRFFKTQTGKSPGEFR